MSMHFGELARRSAAGEAVTHNDILTLRREVWPDGRISQQEAEAIFALHQRMATPSEEWTAFFVEAIGEYVLNQRAPVGYVDAENAAWLIAQIRGDGRLESLAELELLLRVFERALNVDQSLKEFCIAEIERAVIENEGPTRGGGSLEKGRITAAEAHILRRAVFAPASERPAGVGASEAAMLFRLKDATLGTDNAPEWKQLFVQGVANYLCGYTGENAQISRERAADLEAFVADTESSAFRFLSRLRTADWSGFRNMFAPQSPLVTREDRAAAAGAVTDGEREWLDRLIANDGTVDEYEAALLAFLAEA